MAPEDPPSERPEPAADPQPPPPPGPAGAPRSQEGLPPDDDSPSLPPPEEGVGAPRDPHDSFRRNIAFVIVIVSVMGALVAWRASETSDDSGDLVQVSLQDQTLREQAFATNRGNLLHDIRLLGNHEAHVTLARLLSRDADRVPDPDVARRLELEAQSERQLARSQERFFKATIPTEDEGKVSYDFDFALDFLRRFNSEASGLDPEGALKESNVLSDRAVDLTAITTLFAAALLFLTLAEVTRRGVRAWFAAAGCAAALIALVLFLTT